MMAVDFGTAKLGIQDADPIEPIATLLVGPWFALDVLLLYLAKVETAP